MKQLLLFVLSVLAIVPLTVLLSVATVKNLTLTGDTFNPDDEKRTVVLSVAVTF